MSAAEPIPRSIGLAERTPLQTFVAPTEARPVALSVLWMPMPISPEKWAEPFWKLIFQEEIKDVLKDEWGRDPLNALKFLEDPSAAIEHFLLGTMWHEQALTRFLLEMTERPPIELMRYAVTLHDVLFTPANLRKLHGTPLLDVPIVINRSPPSEEILGKLLSSGVIGIGAYAGISIVPAEANPYLLLACVSGGIICISTAAGIGRALQDGIYQRLLRVFDDTPEGKKKPARSDRSR